LAHELDAESASAVGRENVDVGQVDEGCAVREGAREADLPPAVVEADDAIGVADEPLDDIARPPCCPVRLVREEVVHGVDIDACRIVVENETVAELAPHARSLAKGGS